MKAVSNKFQIYECNFSVKRGSISNHEPYTGNINCNRRSVSNVISSTIESLTVPAVFL